MNRRTCAKTKRTKFKDEIAAKMALAQIEVNDTQVRRPIRTYRCPFCKNFHLTSQPDRFNK